MAAPYGPTSPPQPHRRRAGSLIVPVVLIFVGAVFLLQNVGVLPPTVWGNLWRLWPVILVLAGLELLLGRRMPWLFAVAGLVLVVFALGLAASANSVPSTGREAFTTRTLRTDLNGARQAAITVRFGAGQLAIGPQAGGEAGQLAAMTFVGPSDIAPVPTYTLVGDAGRLEYQLSGRSAPNFLPFANGSSQALRLELGIAPDVPITSLVVQTGATDARIDLSSLKVANVDMAVGAATTWLRMPEGGFTTAHISGGAASITMDIPPGVAAQIRHRGGLSAFNIDQSRFPAVSEQLNRSPDYDTATNKVDITIETGVTTIQVN